MSDELQQVVEAAEAEGLAALPTQALLAHVQLDASPRLLAHHHLVHDVALALLTRLDDALLEGVDQALVRFGAATHDIGKALFPVELTRPGVAHELAGEAKLIELGAGAKPARFARTHGLTLGDPSLDQEDRLVIAADKLWKGKRVRDLEEAIAKRGDVATDFERYLSADAVFEEIAASADARLGWQMRFAVRWGD